MNKQSPIFRDLAVAVASALECDEMPTSLRDPLNEIASALIDQLSGGNTALELRALAGLAQSGHTETRAEAKSFAVARSGAKNGALNGASGKYLSLRVRR